MFFSYFPPPSLCPSEGHRYGASTLISINLWGTLCQITRVWNTAQTWGWDRVLIYLSSITCQFLDFLQWMVFDFYFDGVTVKTGNNVLTSKRRRFLETFFKNILSQLFIVKCFSKSLFQYYFPSLVFMLCWFSSSRRKMRILAHWPWEFSKIGTIFFVLILAEKPKNKRKNK